MSEGGREGGGRKDGRGGREGGAGTLRMERRVRNGGE